MSRPSTQIIAPAKLPRLLISIVACGVSLAFVVAGSLQTLVHAELERNAVSTPIELRILNPLRDISRWKFQKTEFAIVEFTKTEPVRAPKRIVLAPIRMRAAVAARPAPTVKKQRAAVVAKSGPNNLRAILEIAEYITGENLALQQPKALEARGVLVTEGLLAKATLIIDMPKVEAAAWLALVKDAKKFERQAAVEAKRVARNKVKVVAKLAQPKAVFVPTKKIARPSRVRPAKLETTAKALVSLPLVANRVAVVTQPRTYGPPSYIKEAAVKPEAVKVATKQRPLPSQTASATKAAASALAVRAPALEPVRGTESVQPTPGEIRDRVDSLVASLNRDVVTTEMMGIQENIVQETMPQHGDAAADDAVAYAKKVLEEELPAAAGKTSIAAPVAKRAPAISAPSAPAGPAAPPPPSEGLPAEPSPTAAPAPTETTQNPGLPTTVVSRTGGKEGEKTATNPGVASNSRFVNIIGKLGDDARLFPGHFEIGFYRAVNPNGVPIGAPVIQSILRAKRLDFLLKVPRRARGYLFARFVSADPNFRGKEWHTYPMGIDLREVKGDRVLLTIPIHHKEIGKPLSVAALSNEKTVAEVAINGRVGAMFAPKGSLLPLDGVKVRVRGTRYETTSGKDGRFSFRFPNAKGRLFLEFLKSGYMPRIQEISLSGTGESATVPDVFLPSREAIRHMAHSLGVRHTSTASVLIVEAKTRAGDSGLPGISAQMTLKGDGPYYFSEKGFPQIELKSTTNDGRMIFFNVEPGVGFLEAFVLGENFTPFVVSPLGGGEVIHQTIDFFEGETKITGKLFDPIQGRNGNLLPINGAKVRVAGGAEWTETDSFGNFELPNFKFVRDTEILIEVTKHGYYNHRFAYKIPADKARMKELQLFAFPQDYINKLATSVEVQLDPNFGMLMGKVSGGERLRVDALLDHDGDNVARDFYFDSHNVIQGSHALTDPSFGTYMIFDVSPGRVLLHAHNQSGSLRAAEVGYFTPSTINVIIAE